MNMCAQPARMNEHRRSPRSSSDIALNRRQCLIGAAAAASAALSGTLPLAESAAAAQTKLPIQKAVKYGMVSDGDSMTARFRLLKELGFDGVELSSPNEFSLDEVLRARDEAELPIHGVVNSRHWRDTLSHQDPEVRTRGMESVKKSIHDAKAYGATSVLVVPAVVNKDVSYADAYTRSQEQIRQVLPLAEDLGIRVLFENVWNQFLLSPLETARYIDEFESPVVGAYFDVGNVVTYGWPEQWIRILGPRIVKLDIKEFSRKRRDEEGRAKGFGVEIGDGDCDWPAVRAALADVGFAGWATAEVPGGDRDRLADIADRMNQALAL